MNCGECTYSPHKLCKMKMRGCFKKYEEFPKKGKGGARMAQLVEHLTRDFGSGRDFRLVRSSPVSGSVLSVESA